MTRVLSRRATTSSPAPRSSAASRTSTPTPTTCSRRTSGSSPPPWMPRSPPTRPGRLKKVTYMSSSMVFESTDRWPSKEGDERLVPPPLSSYGFQKLAVEYFAHAAWDQYKLPYTIVRPFNCVGIGESRALGDVEIDSGNVKLAMSHVVPDLVQKILKGQDPLHILGNGEQVRHYTYGGDLAQGIALTPRSPRGAEQRLQHLDTPRPHGAPSSPRRSGTRSRERMFRCASFTTRASSTTCRSACPTSARPKRCSASKPPPRSTRCSTRSSRGSRRP